MGRGRSLARTDKIGVVSRSQPLWLFCLSCGSSCGRTSRCRCHGSLVAKPSSSSTDSMSLNVIFLFLYSPELNQFGGMGAALLNKQTLRPENRKPPPDPPSHVVTMRVVGDVKGSVPLAENGLKRHRPSTSDNCREGMMSLTSCGCAETQLCARQRTASGD